MNLKIRLTNLEAREKAARPVRIFVYFEGDDFGTCNGERLTLAEWEAIKDPDTVTLKVVYDKNKEKTE